VRVRVRVRAHVDSRVRVHAHTHTCVYTIYTRTYVFMHAFMQVRGLEAVPRRLLPLHVAGTTG
jgi:hypothetical protein